MRLPLIALAAVLAASATPAAAYDTFDYAGAALADDTYPPGEIALPPSVQRLVIARQGKGLSLAGFYNDPSLAFRPRYVPASYGYAPPGPDLAPPPPPQVAPDYVEAPPAPAEYGYDVHHRGPRVIFSPYGHGRRFAHERERHRVY